MKLTKAILLSLAVLLPSNGIWGQTANRPYTVRFSGPTPESLGSTARLRELMVEGWQLKPSDAAELESKLARDVDNLPLRLRLMSYYAQYLMTEAHASHVLWLIEHHPAEDVLKEPSPIVRLQPSPAVATQEALWKQQASRFPADARVLRNAAVAMFGANPELAITYIKAARQVEPSNVTWTSWLAKTYASAIRWTLWDGAATLDFAGNAEDFRYLVPFNLPLELCWRARAEIEASDDAGLVEAAGQAMVREVSLLEQRDGTADLPQVRQFGVQLIERARVLRMKPRA